MKRLVLLLFALVPFSIQASEAPAPAHGATTYSPLSEGEQALTFDPRLMERHALDLDPHSLAEATPWELMELVQTLSGTLVPLSRFGNGHDELTEAWRQKLTQEAHHHADHPEDPFDPALVVWDPGTIQFQNEWGQWAIRIDQREITQGDLDTLSPLEIQQAVRVLTGRIHPIEFILEHLEAFRAQLSIVPRVTSGDVAPVHH